MSSFNKNKMNKGVSIIICFLFIISGFITAINLNSVSAANVNDTTNVVTENTYSFEEDYFFNNTYTIVEKTKLFTTPDGMLLTGTTNMVLNLYNSQNPTYPINSPITNNDVYFGVDLNFNTKIHYSGNYTIRTTVEGDGLWKTVTTELIESYESYEFEMKPYFDIYIEREDNSTKDFIQRHIIKRFPLPVLENVDGGDDNVKLDDLTIYFWNDYVKIGEIHNINNNFGNLVSNIDSIPLAKWPILEIVEAVLDQCSYIFPAAKTVGSFIGFIGEYLIQISFIISLDIDQSIQNFLYLIADTLPSNQVFTKFRNDSIMNTPALGFIDGNINDRYDCLLSSTQQVRGNFTDSKVTFTPVIFWNVRSNISFGGYLRIEPADHWIGQKIFDWFVKTDYIDIEVFKGVAANENTIQEWVPLRTGWYNVSIPFDNINNNLPSSDLQISDDTPYINQNVIFDCSGSTDPDTDPLKYQIDFGDSLCSGWVGTSSIEHIYTVAGTYDVKLKVSDGTDVVEHASAQVVVTDPYGYFEPEVDIILNPTGEIVPNTLVNIDVSGSNVFNFTTATIHYYFGDNSSEVSSNQITSHIYTEPGKYTVTVFIEDERQNYNVSSKGITVINNTRNYIDNSILIVIDDENAGEVMGDSSTELLNLISNEPFPQISLIDTYLVGDIDEDGDIDVSGSNGPNSTVMGYYELVIWVTGDAWNNTLTAQDKIYIEDYTQLNGKIWLIGSDIFYLDVHDPEIGDFAYDILGIDYILEDNGISQNAYGSEYGDIYEGQLIDIELPAIDYSDCINSTINGQNELLNFTNNSENFAVSRSQGNGMSLTYAFVFSAIASYERYGLFSKTIDWFFMNTDTHQTFEDAEVIHNGFRAQRSILESDWQLYQIECSIGHNINITVSQNNSGHDYDLYIYDEEYNLEVFDESTDQNFTILYNIPITEQNRTILYINVSSFSGSGEYELLVKITDFDDFSLISEGDSTEGIIDRRYDENDYFSLNCVVGETYGISLSFEFDLLIDFDLYIYADDWTQLDYSWYNDPTEEVTITAEYTGTHFIEVNAYYGVGRYNLQVHEIINYSTLTDSATSPTEIIITGDSAYYQLYIDHLLNPVDYLQIWSSNFETLTFKLNDPSFFGELTNENQDFDIYVYYNGSDVVNFSDDNQIVGLSTSYGSNETITIETKLYGEGYYYISIKAYSGRGNCSLQILDNNDNETNATKIPYPDYDFYSSLDYYQEYDYDRYDWYEIYMYEGEILEIEMVGEDNYADFDLSIYFDGNYIDGSFSLSNCEFLNISILTTGYYYINVSAWEGYGYYWLSLNLNEKPYIIANETNFEIDEGESLIIPLTAYDFDFDPINVWLVNAPSGMSYNLLDLGFGEYLIEIEWVPSYSQAGSYDISVHVQDVFQSTQESIHIQVTDVDASPPEISWVSKPIEGTTGENITISLTATDENPITKHNISVNGIEYTMMYEAPLYYFNVSIPTDNITQIEYFCLFEDSLGYLNTTGIVVVNIIDNDFPLANAGTDLTANEGTLLTFDGSASSDNIGINNYTWTFNYNNSLVNLYGISPEFYFWTSGNYTVFLNVTDSEGNWNTSSMITKIIMVPDSTLPVSNAGPNQTVNEGDIVIFDGSDSTDNVGIINYTWNFTFNSSVVSLYGVSSTYNFSIPGNYTINLIVQDSAGNRDTDTMNVIVNPVSLPPADSDGDGIPDSEDDFPDDPDEDTDTDGDGTGDNADAFPNDSDEDTDTDGDGIGNNADPDDDNDGVPDEEDPEPLNPEVTGKGGVGDYLWIILISIILLVVLSIVGYKMKSKKLASSEEEILEAEDVSEPPSENEEG